MKISRRRLAQQLVRLIAQDPARQKTLLKQTAAYLIATKQTNQAHLLVHDIAQLLEAQGHVSATVRSAFGLSAGTRDQIKTMLKKATNAKTIELSEQVQPELLGGIVVRTASAQLDTSVRTQLKQIARLGVSQ